MIVLSSLRRSHIYCRMKIKSGSRSLRHDRWWCLINQSSQTFRLSLLPSMAANQGGSLLGSTSSTAAPFAFPGRRRLTLGESEELASSLSSSLTSGLSTGPKFGLFITLLDSAGLNGPGLSLLSAASILDDTTRDNGAVSKCLGTPMAFATAAASWSVAEGSGPMMLFRLVLSKE
jgi:hypothetical protein